MDRNWMRLIEQGGDDSVGAALVRLARQAAAVHTAEAARQFAEDEEVDDAGLGGTETRLRCVTGEEAGEVTR